MSIRKRGKDGVWQIEFSSRGQRIRKSAGTVDKNAAQQLHDKLKAEVWRVSKLNEKPLMTWQHAVKQWIEEKNHKKDLKGDKGTLRWLDPHLRNFYLKDISKEKIEEIIAAKKNENPEVSNGRINRILALLRSILRMAHKDWEWIDRVPNIRFRKEPSERVRWLTPEEAARLIKELWSAPHIQDMASFSLNVGLREANICGLTWKQVDLKRCHAWVYVDAVKGTTSIPVPLNSTAMEILRRWHGKHEKYVFVYKGRPLRHCNYRAWRKALVRAKIKNFRWHDLRHTWASWHVQSGTSLQELQQLGGWASYRMVLKYAHLSANHLKAAAERITDKNKENIDTNLPQVAKED